MTEHDRFSTLAVEFETLQKQFETAGGPSERRILLDELRGKLGEIDELVKRHLDQSAGN